MKKITFTITLDEINKIFKALGKEQFSEVYELIGVLNEQVNAQLNRNSSEKSKKK
jgi:hypothetical protein